MFRYAQRVNGTQSSFVELTHTIIQKSGIVEESRPSLKMHPLQLFRWFVSNKGKELSPKEKPLDTPAHKSNQLIWVKEWYDILTDKYANVAMLDEKWFYTTNRRRKIKKLPIGPGEMDGDDTTKYP